MCGRLSTTRQSAQLLMSAQFPIAYDAGERRRGNTAAACPSAISAPRRPSGIGAAMSTEGPDGEGPDTGADVPQAGGIILRMLLGSQLRRLREAAGVTPDRARYEIRASRSKISRVEDGRVRLKERDVAGLLALYGVTDEQERAHMLALAQHANSRGWWARYDDVMPDWFETYVGLEQATSLIRSYELQFVPGLLQTEGYVRALTRLGHRTAPADEIERRVSLRLKRQQVLSGSGPAPKFWAVIDESALRRPLGGREVMRDQIRHLIDLTDRANVTLQVVP